MRIEIIAKESGERIDALLARSIEGLSRSRAQKLIAEGLVTLNGIPAQKSQVCKIGEVYLVFLPEDTGDKLPEAEDIKLCIAYEDEDIIVVNKKRGMVVHPAPGHTSGTLVSALLAHTGGRLSDIGGETRPGIVHRIDKETSGLIIAAKNNEAHAALKKQLQKHEIVRIYEAVILGNLKSIKGTIDKPIGRHPVHRKKMAIVEGGRNAVTHYESVAKYRGYEHIKCRLETGRTHQIRVHLASVGHPLLGDSVYGKGKEKGLTGQCLHARELSFIHPINGEKIEILTDLPEYFTDVLGKLGAKSE